jgi:two-component system, NarL family, response regulator NreC
MAIKILIADDHGLIRSGLRALLDDHPEFQVIGEANDGRAALKMALELQPDIVLMDINMPGISGLEATQRLHEIAPDARVLALTVYDDESMLREMIRAGAYGYIIKRAAETELIQAILAISQGNIYIHPALTKALVKDLSPHNSAGINAELLTPREIDVLVLLARGYTNRQIAEELNLSPRTIEGHRANLVSKLGIKSRVELMNYVEEHGLKGQTKPNSKSL